MAVIILLGTMIRLGVVRFGERAASVMPTHPPDRARRNLPAPTTPAAVSLVTPNTGVSVRDRSRHAVQSELNRAEVLLRMVTEEQQHRLSSRSTLFQTRCSPGSW
jgi:hypothetical protein